MAADETAVLDLVAVLAAGRGADGGAGHGASRGPGPAVAEVAARCGFTSATYFSHAFRERFGRPAGEVRRAAVR